ncbi:hypothetical protein ES705_08186 [subsurface metagenome]|jgi:hypothetical protein
MLDDELKELLSECFDDEEDWETLAKRRENPQEVLAKTKEALQLINEYSLDFPDSLSKAVKILAKYAVGYGYGYGKQT